MTRLEQLATLSHEELVVRLHQAEQPRQQGKLTVKSSPKGAVQVLGLGSKFGVTQYPETWIALFDIADRIREHIMACQAELSFKRGIPSMGIEPNEFQAAE